MSDSTRQETLGDATRRLLFPGPPPDEDVSPRGGQPCQQQVVLRVDAARMYADGHGFVCSAPGVWPTDDVPPAYLTEA